MTDPAITQVIAGLSFVTVLGGIMRNDGLIVGMGMFLAIFTLILSAPAA